MKDKGTFESEQNKNRKNCILWSLSISIVIRNSTFEVQTSTQSRWQCSF